MYSLKLASGTAIVITDQRLIKELLDKRSSVSSDRPPVYALDELVYQGDYLLFMSHTNPWWKAGRRFIHQYFMENVVEKKHMPVMMQRLSRY